MENELLDIKGLLSTTLNVEENRMVELRSKEDILQWLTEYIDYLISNDFDALLLLLYRIDVSEQKVRSMLAVNKGENSARTIADLILERQIQKLYWRNKFKNSPTHIDDEERW